MSQALVFPGQGAQYVGMAMPLAAQFPAAKALLDQADAVLGFKLSQVIAEGPESELTRTDISQPAILVASLMALEALKSTRDLRGMQGIQAVAGLSLGEYTALVAAGSLTFADAVKLVRLRGEAMQAAASATEHPASSARPGPGEMMIASWSPARASAALSTSHRTTATSAPSTRK